MDNHHQNSNGRITTTIVIPALNEEEGILKTLDVIPRDELEKMGYGVEIIVVDNGSSDATAEVARKAGATVVTEPTRGYGQALRTGFAHAKGDIIITADADATYPLEDIPKLINILQRENLDFLTTNRFAHMEKDAMGLLHRLGNSILSLTFRILYRVDLKDSQSGMWVFRREILKDTLLRSPSMPMSEELKIEAIHFQKLPWREIPIRYSVRVGEAKISSWKHGLANLMYLFKNLMYLFKKRVIR